MCCVTHACCMYVYPEYLCERERETHHCVGVGVDGLFPVGLFVDFFTPSRRVLTHTCYSTRRRR